MHFKKRDKYKYTSKQTNKSNSRMQNCNDTTIEQIVYVHKNIHINITYKYIYIYTHINTHSRHRYYRNTEHFLCTIEGPNSS